MFDLGGVVIEVDFGRCVARWATSAGHAFEDIATRFCFDAAYEDHERGVLDRAAYFVHLRRTLAVELDDNELLDGWNDIYLGADAEVCGLLTRAQFEFPLYAFTNSNPSHRAVWSERFANVLELFTSIFVSSDLGQRKPDRGAFDAISSLIGVSPSSILFFDDSAENVAGALDAGLHAVHASSTDAVRTALAHLGVHVQ